MVEHHEVRRGKVMSDPINLGAQASTNGANITQHRPISRWLVNALLRVADTLVLIISAILAYIVYLELVVGAGGTAWGNYGVVVFLAAFLQINLFNLAGVYERTAEQQSHLRPWSVVGAWTTLFSILIIVGFLTKTSEQFSRGWVLSWYVFGLVGTLGARQVDQRAAVRPA